jgi:hypothetical protein
MISLNVLVRSHVRYLAKKIKRVASRQHPITLTAHVIKRALIGRAFQVSRFAPDFISATAADFY